MDEQVKRLIAVTPHPRQLAWQGLEFTAFFHFGINTFTGREWGDGSEDPALFNPAKLDTDQWCAAVKDAGIRGVLITAKHHDGFCLFDSALTDYKSTNTPCGRDLVREYLEAFRAEGIKVGLYYSLLDWHHPDYPHYGDQQHPMRDNEAYRDYTYDFDRYLEYMHGQVKELCTNYGKIDLLWFDFSYGEMSGEKWRATDLVRMVRSYQPDVLIDNRLTVNNVAESGKEAGSLMSGDPAEYSGDFVSPEQIIPPEGIRDINGNPVAWEACITMNNNWGYCATDKHFKPADMMIKKLVECVSKNGNLLLNVGPDARGNIPEESLDILEKIGRWMRHSSASIYGCGGSTLPKPDYGRITAAPGKLYFHVTEPLIGYVPLMGVHSEQVKQIRLLCDGSELKIARTWITDNYPDVTFVSFGESPLLPDPVDTVIEVQLKD